MEKEHSGLFFETIRALSLMMDLDENEKLYHSWRVGIMSAKIADIIAPDEKREIFYAGLLHDIGGIALPDHIIHYHKIEEHFKNPIIFNHPEKGSSIVEQIPGLVKSAAMIKQHHEMWNGEGYPNRIKGSEISTGAQILRISDTFDLVNRSLKNQILKEVSLRLKKKAGKEYSHEMFEAWRKAVSEEGFYELIKDNDNLTQLMDYVIKTLPEMGMKMGLDAFDTIINVFAEVIDAKHIYTAGHSKRVADYSIIIAEAMGLNKKQVQKIKYAGYVHDAGKVAIPSYILDKKAKLTEEEFDLIKKHPIYTMEILSTISHLSDIIPIAGYHHERYDGLGYPNGYFGKRTPLGARIMAVADSLDAMTSPRPYQGIKTGDDAKKELKKYAGTQFDPIVSEAACDVLNCSLLAKK